MAYYLILCDDHRRAQRIVCLLPALHLAHHPLPRAQWPPLMTPARVQHRGNAAKALQRSRRWRELCGAAPARLPHTAACVSNVLLAAAPHQDKTEAGESDGRGVTGSLHYTSVHSWVGWKERARKRRKKNSLTSFHSLSSSPFVERPWPLLAI